MASVGFDWLLVDTEHGPIDLATLATMFATITRYPVRAVRARARAARGERQARARRRRVGRAGAEHADPRGSRAAGAQLQVPAAAGCAPGRRPLSAVVQDRPGHLLRARQRRDPGHRPDRAPRGDQEHRRHPLGARGRRLLRRSERPLRVDGAGALAGAAAPRVPGGDATCCFKAAPPSRRGAGDPLRDARDGEPPHRRGLAAGRHGERSALSRLRGQGGARRREDRPLACAWARAGRLRRAAAGRVHGRRARGRSARLRHRAGWARRPATTPSCS